MTHATDAHPVSLSASTVAAMLRLGVGLDELGGATVTGATGVLAGTTETDTHLTISATTATTFRLYIENRTGGVRAYNYTILSGNNLAYVAQIVAV